MTAAPTTNAHPTTPTASGPLPAMPAAPPAAALRRRRRPAVLGLGVALVTVGALAAVWLATSGGQRVAVLTVARSVDLGQVITSDDLAVARIPADPALRPIPARLRAQVVGRHAATDLRPGTLLTRRQVTNAVAPAAGFSLVGVAVRPTQLPAQDLRPGDRLQVVSTPPIDGDVGTDPPATVDVTVFRVGSADETGVRIVDVTVPALQSADLAARSATGRIALVLQSRGR